MQRHVQARLLERLQQGWRDASPPFIVPAARYRDPARLARELAAFTAPRPVLASTALAPGACAPVDGIGAPALVVRGQDGTVRAFANSCRHRAMRLRDEPGALKALVCPYHGWTYDLAGALIHVPHAEAFTDCAHRDLRALAAAERHGLIWLGGGVDDYLGELGADLAALELGAHVPWRSSRVTRACNWKLIIEAFLDGYHLRVLHRDSIYRFFIDAASAPEQVGPHIRAVSARRPLREAPPVTLASELAELGTPSFVIFPGSVIICHPDSISLLSLVPVAPDSTIVEHTLLVPAARKDDAAHWDRTWAMIDDAVVQREDLWACEQIQRGLDDELLFGALESAVRWFHASLDAVVGEDRVP
ncbi:MAG TPA: aromatic ring-hydroxylating dioxygenase subunit alpha [Kofleriaceae bacterium]|jgi:phenylpropionate dioxygenase-like ring-hydroxylating dioxygenase large terminal subunit